MNMGLHPIKAWNALVGADIATTEEERLLEFLGIDKDESKDKLGEVTYFTCLKMLSETMGKLPIKFYQETDRGRIKAKGNDVMRVLTVKPNDYMTPSTMWASVEMNCQHYGNGYIWLRGSVDRTGVYGGKYTVKDAWVLPSKDVMVLIDDAGVFGTEGKIYYQYTDERTGKVYTFNSDEIIHVKTWYSFDGILGVPVKDILKHVISGAKEAQTFMSNLYEQGLTASMALQYTGDLDKDRRDKLKTRYADALTGAKNAGKIIPVPKGLTLTPLKMSLADSQFFELRKYSALQIAAAFGIKPNQINDYDKASYANSEMQQLAFLVDTMAFRLKHYEEEINKKALSDEEIEDGFFFKFNEKAILRTDAATQMNILTSAVNNGIYSPNEARDYLDMPAREGGDVLMVNGNYIPITMVGEQYRSEGGE